ncbi:MAG: 2TM domain-containing protein [Pseudolysinimonas sp.]|uniref:2TM domain-containing protein n=1 Tax=Pseudolysinimonas sp. TaxID=2680009 RepID=UPI003C78737A
MPISDADEIRAAARARLKARNDFKIMLAIFGVIIVVLVAIGFFSTGRQTGFTSYFWPVWPILGMTIAAVFVGLDANGITRRTSAKRTSTPRSPA